ncbi:MAG: MerR family transcriptional regulator [Holdemanella sp.]|nr:MerR family transcriptional regulator [Holdemanella sp.]
MKISEVCKQTEMNKRTIHFYIEEKMVFPSINKNNGYYDFNEEDVKKLLFIKDLRNAGISIPEIRSLLNNPQTASHFLGFHIRRLKKEKEFIEKNIISMQYILNHLSNRTDFNELYELEKKANIPTPNTIINTEFDSYIVSIINHFLWGPFFPKKLSDYQEYIMKKLNDEILENQIEEYKTLSQFFKTLNPKTIELLYEKNYTRYDYIVSLKEEQIEECVQDMIAGLTKQIQDVYLQNVWRKYYFDYFSPTTTLYASSYSKYIYESNEYFRSYLNNISKVLNQLYGYLHSEKGKKLNEDLHRVYKGYLNIESNNHGELEALFNLKLSSIIFKEDTKQ